MAVVSLPIVVSNIVDVMTLFNRIKVYRSTTGTLGPYVELTTAATRIALQADETVYNFVDTDGDDDYYYKTSFFHSGTGIESSLSDPMQGSGDPALDVISVEELKNHYLFGVSLIDGQGQPFPDSLYQWYIKSAVSWVERMIDVPLRPLVIEDEKQDYDQNQYEKNIWIQLDHYPVISVEAIRMVIPPKQTAINFDMDWVELDEVSGTINIIPGASQILLGSASVWVPTLMTRRFLMNVWHIDYTAGFQKGQVPYDIRDLVGKVAALGPLNIAGDLVFGAGLAAQSVNVDGLMTSIQTTQSPTNAGYGARILEYWREIKQQWPIIRRHYKGVPIHTA